jgi:hypothetical protein
MEATHEATQSFQCPFCEFSDTREWLVRSHINLSDAGSHLNRGGFFKEDELERRGPDGEVTETVAGDPRSRYETLHSLGTENMPSGLSTTERVILQTTVQNLSKSYSEIETLVNDRLRETTREMVDYNKVYRTIIETLGVARKSSNMSSSKQTATYDELTRKQRAVINEYIRDAEQSMATIASNLGVESSYAEEVIEQYGDLADRMTNVDVVPVDSSNGFDENTTMTDQAAEEQYNGLTQLERTVVDELVENPRKQNQRIATDVGCDTAFPDKIETKYSELIHHRRTTAENGPITVEAGEVNYVIQPDLKEALDELTQREQTVVFELIQEPNPLDPISPETIGRTVGADEEFVAETIDAHKGTIIRVNNEALPAQHLSRETTTPTTEPAETQTTEPEPFDQRFRAALEDGDVTAVTAAEITEHIDEIESPDAIRRAAEQDDRKTTAALYESRLAELEPDTKQMATQESQEQQDAQQTTTAVWADEERPFPERLEAAVDAEAVPELNVELIRRNVSTVEDVELVRQANVQDDRKTSTTAFENQIDRLTETETTVDETESFEAQLRAAVDAENMKSVTVISVRRNVSEITDVDLLEDALELDDRKTSSKALEERIEELTDEEPPEAPEPTTAEPAVETETVEPEPTSGPTQMVPATELEQLHDLASTFVRTAQVEIDHAENAESAARVKSVAEEFQRMVEASLAD